jgi:hypothetical protein
VALAFPSAAAAGSSELYEEYRRSGVIDGCAHGTGELSEALSGVPADIKAYDPGFADALNVALERRAAGCRGVAAADPLVPVAVAGTRRAADGSPGPRDPRAAAAPAAAEFGAEEFPVGTLFVVIGAAAAALCGALVWGRRGAGGER